MIARNYLRFPEALTRQLELALTATSTSAQSIGKAIARAVALLPAGSRPDYPPTLRKPAKAPLRAYRAATLPWQTWWRTGDLFA